MFTIDFRNILTMLVEKELQKLNLFGVMEK